MEKPETRIEPKFGKRKSRFRFENSVEIVESRIWRVHG
jgi:hypothetical protein